MKRLLLFSILLVLPVITVARTVAFRVWVPNPCDSARWNLRLGVAIDQTGLATIDSSGYFVYWDVTFDDTTTYSLQATYYRVGMAPVSGVVIPQLVYDSSVETVKYALWLPQAADSVRWRLRAAGSVSSTGLATLDSSNMYAYWSMSLDSASRYICSVDYYYTGSSRPITDIENLTPFGTGGSSTVVFSDSIALGRWVWNYVTRSITDPVTLTVAERQAIADTVLNDSSAYQGATSGLTAQAVAEAVADLDTTGHSAPGTLGGEAIKTGGGGSGCGDSLGYTRTIVVLDTSATPDVVINGFEVFFNNAAQSGEPYSITTNNLGRSAIGLNAGTWIRLHSDSRYLPETDTFTVAGVGTDTLKLCQAITVDADTLTTTVAFYVKKPDGVGNDSAAVTIELLPVYRDSLMRLGSTALGASYAQMLFRADEDGRALIHLYPNTLIVNDSCYRATVRNRFNDKIIETFRFFVPATDTVVNVNYLQRWK